MSRTSESCLKITSQPDEVPVLSMWEDDLASTEERQEALRIIEHLLACGLGPASALWQAVEQRLRRAHLELQLAQAFPHLSPEARDGCIARHLQRWKQHHAPEHGAPFWRLSAPNDSSDTPDTGISERPEKSRREPS